MNAVARSLRLAVVLYRWALRKWRGDVRPEWVEIPAFAPPEPPVAPTVVTIESLSAHYARVKPPMKDPGALNLAKPKRQRAPAKPKTDRAKVGDGQSTQAQLVALDRLHAALRAGLVPARFKLVEGISGIGVSQIGFSKRAMIDTSKRPWSLVGIFSHQEYDRRLDALRSKARKK